ncbi:MAG: AmmeMemoRadiSam system radical SAM enzyme [Deltaproteobacteria bacterium]|nr:AmmeMemoRadiSam system radical SAM enzyme [Deltaproteobacteria bacterium]
MQDRRLQLEPGVVVGEEFVRLDDGRVRCNVCPRQCTLSDGQRAFCYVRQAKDGQVVLTAYGRSSGFCVDPVEKKPLNHFFPGSSVLSFGTAGCNLGCRFCQNWDMSKAREMERLSDAALPDDIAAAAKELGCLGVAFTYNDPVMFFEYAADTAAACREVGLKTIAVTAGYATQPIRERLLGTMDACNVDLKAFTEEFYSKLCFAHLQPVLETLEYLHHQTSSWLEVTTLLIPGHNDSEAEIAKLAEWYVEHLGPDVPLHFSAFHPDFKMMDTPPTPPATLRRARAQAKAAGLHHVYTGNIHDQDGQSTYCAGCGRILIERDWYQLGSYHVVDGACEYCRTPLPGHFTARPGRWGPRRLPVVLEHRA